MPETYAKTFLDTVMVRYDYLQPTEYTRTQVESIRKSVSEWFPTLRSEQRGVFEVVFEERGQKVHNRQYDAHLLVDADGKNTLLFEPPSLTMEIRHYKNFEQISPILAKVAESLPDQRIKRLGLRYVNVLTFPTGNAFDWPYVDARLRDLLKFVNEAKLNTLNRAVGQLEWVEEDYRLRFQFGWPNSGYPNKISKREFFLDYDCFAEEEMLMRETPDRLKKFNEAITDMFERSITDDLRTYMRQEAA